MTDVRRLRLTPDERRAQLVAAGVNFLADHPLDALTMDELAARAGVSRALLFHYFENRQGMHRAVVTTARDALLQASEPDAALPPRERIRDTLLRIAAFVRDHGGTFFSLVRGVASGDESVRAVVDESRAVNAQLLLDAFVELGEPDTEALRVTLRAWVSFAEEVLVERAVGRTPDLEPLVDFLERTLAGVVTATRGTGL